MLSLAGMHTPNSVNQRWSKWAFVVEPSGMKRPTFAEVKHNAARFARCHFGQASAMKISEYFDDRGQQVFEIVIRTEGHPVHEPAFVAWMRDQWAIWAENGFGSGTVVTLTEAKLEAGTRQDGTPSEQLIMCEPLEVLEWQK